jgi:hypothetical protein
MAMNDALLTRVLDELSSSGTIADETWAELMASAGDLSEPDLIRVVDALDETRQVVPIGKGIAFEPPSSIGGAVLVA